MLTVAQKRKHFLLIKIWPIGERMGRIYYINNPCINVLISSRFNVLLILFQNIAGKLGAAACVCTFVVSLISVDLCQCLWSLNYSLQKEMLYRHKCE